MNKKILIVVTAVLLMAAGTSFAQPKRVMVVRSAPTFTLQVNAIYNQAFLEFNGTYNNDFHSPDFRNGDNLGADKGLGISLTSKIALSERGRLRLIFSADYSNFQSYLFGKNNLLADVGNSTFNVYSFGVGLEHNFTPNYKFKIFMGAEGTGNMISGKSTNWVYVRGGTNYTYDLKITNSFRIGAAIFGGTEYMLNDRMGLSLGFKYNVANLLLKDAKQTDDPNATEIPLRDASDSNVKYAGRKTLAYMSILAGVNFYWGIQQTRYTIK